MELVTLLSLAAVVAGLLLPPLARLSRRPQAQEVVDQFQTLERALRDYYEDTRSFVALEDVHGVEPVRDGATYRHFVTGDGVPGWNGPYLSRLFGESPLGGRYDLTVRATDCVVVTLGSRAALGNDYVELLAALDERLDGDGDPARGNLWGDARGIHLAVGAGSADPEALRTTP